MAPSLPTRGISSPRRIPSSPIAFLSRPLRLSPLRPPLRLGRRRRCSSSSNIFHSSIIAGRGPRRLTVSLPRARMADAPSPPLSTHSPAASIGFCLPIQRRSDWPPAIAPGSIVHSSILGCSAHLFSAFLRSNNMGDCKPRELTWEVKQAATRATGER